MSEAQERLARNKAKALVAFKTPDIARYIKITVEAASLYFANDPDDFKVFLVGECAIVFGESNRVTWYPDRGFTVSTLHSTPEFRAHFESIGAQPRTCP